MFWELIIKLNFDIIGLKIVSCLSWKRRIIIKVKFTFDGNELIKREQYVINW